MYDVAEVLLDSFYISEGVKVVLLNFQNGFHSSPQ